MDNAISNLVRALDIGERELELLARGEVEQAGELAHERGMLMDLAHKTPPAASAEQIREKLSRLKTLQGRITDEAKRLQQVLREDLKRAKEENKRLAGYRKTVKVTPISSRFISKKS